MRTVNCRVTCMSFIHLVDFFLSGHEVALDLAFSWTLVVRCFVTILPSISASCMSPQAHLYVCEDVLVLSVIAKRIVRGCMCAGHVSSAVLCDVSVSPNFRKCQGADHDVMPKIPNLILCFILNFRCLFDRLCYRTL